ncbi:MULTISPECIES: acyl-CoA thioesterase [unclassified Streptomyces]|uniref:acyl-CoA thioesterase n=1 Tax=unclassified Streptomyces TaxID=2593676 RepID=UPI0022500F3C|nr:MULTISPECIES: acyl-CoA thioesterase [unclassified Streptomyces]MCX4970606.1 acyl-CoA thioesterase [Streptomyces sp. NBC_00654]MEE1736248.1 acyl-CoA thioesterase [Streptomyces sp. BE147]
MTATTGTDSHSVYRHTVAFAETDLCGTADYVTYMIWQGRCRREFFREALGHAEDRADGTRLFTLQADCELLEAVQARDRLSVRVRVADIGHTEFGLVFEYVKETPQGEVLVAHGRQRVAVMSGPPTAPVPAMIPDVLARVLALYAAGSRPSAGRQI